jgi:cation diffusion facilitator CzcD-associated flavoprotein CzcO
LSSLKKRVAIIGAGISGLAHADVLTRCGFSVVLFERASQLGGVWACSYPDVSLQNTWRGYHFSSFPWPFEPDLHPTGTQIFAAYCPADYVGVVDAHLGKNRGKPLMTVPIPT